MEKSKQWLKDHNILPKISFEKDKPRVVRLIDDKPETIMADGKEVNGMKYKVTEDGVPKTIFTMSIALITKLADMRPNETVRILQKGYKDGNDFKTTYEVSKVEMGDEIPTIKEGEPEPEQESGLRRVAPTDKGNEIDINDLSF